MSENTHRLNRRKALSVLGAGVLTSLAGCSTFNSDGSDGQDGIASDLVTERPTRDTVSFEGEGTASDPFLVSNVSQLQYVAQNGEQAYYEQTEDIDAQGTDEWDEAGFQPITPRSGRGFQGVYDGQGNSIRRLSAEGPLDYAGLFAVIDEAGVVKNLDIVDADISGTRAGILASEIAGEATNISVSGSVFGSRDAGGVAGRVSRSGVISSSDAQVKVSSASEFTGGVTGTILDNGTVTATEVSGTVSGPSYGGGVVGGVGSRGTISNTLSDVTVESVEAGAGGIVALLTEDATLAKSFASGEVTGTDQVGGVVGTMPGGQLQLVASDAVVEGVQDVGGVVGFLAAGIDMSDIYSTGSVSADRFGGGIAGRVDGEILQGFTDAAITIREPSQAPDEPALGAVAGELGTNAAISSVYWDGADSEFVTRAIPSTSSNQAGASIIRVDEGDLSGDQAQSALSDLDFTDTWRANPEGYPQLRELDSVRDRESETASPSDSE